MSTDQATWREAIETSSWKLLRTMRLIIRNRVCSIVTPWTGGVEESGPEKVEVALIPAFL
jgi:hypothetical protein